MTLSEEQVTKEVALINNEDGWPFWPILPMKRLGSEDLGIMWARHKNRVYRMMISDLKAGDFEEQAKGVETIEAETTVDLVRMGWVGD